MFTSICKGIVNSPGDSDTNRGKACVPLCSWSQKTEGAVGPKGPKFLYEGSTNQNGVSTNYNFSSQERRLDGSVDLQDA